MPWVDQLEQVEVLGMPTRRTDDTDEIRAGITRAVDRLSAVGVTADGVEVTGHKAGTIVGHAQVVRADLVVLGTRGQGGLKRVLLGSIASAVVRPAPC